MAYLYRHPAFTVIVESGFVEEDRIAVRGRVLYAPEAGLAARRRAGTAALLAMIAGIFRESQSGRARGARRVEVRVDGDRGLSDLFRRLVLGSRQLHAAPQAHAGIPARC